MLIWVEVVLVSSICSLWGPRLILGRKMDKIPKQMFPVGEK